MERKRDFPNIHGLLEKDNLDMKTPIVRYILFYQYITSFFF